MAVLALTSGAGVLAVGASAARPVAGPEATRLAEEAQRNPAAVDDLLAITAIDDVPVDMESLLSVDRRERIEAIAQLHPGEAIDVEDVRRRATNILADPRYPTDRESWLERLLDPVLIWAERALAWVLDRFQALIGWLIEVFESGTGRWIALPLLFLATAIGTWYLGRRRALEVERRAVIERILELGVDPSELMGMADNAEREGDHSEAIRLRFVAGLLYLDAEGVIEFAPGLSNGEISTRVGSPDFETLAAQFDATVYGRIPAGPDESSMSSRLWARVIGAGLIEAGPTVGQRSGDGR